MWYKLIMTKDRDIKNLPAKPQEPIPRDLVKEIALDIGKEVAAHIERMYPKAVEATSKSMLVSVRNCVYNEIMAALGTTDADEIAARLNERKKSRRVLNSLYKNIRDPNPNKSEVAEDLISGKIEPEADY